MGNFGVGNISGSAGSCFYSLNSTHPAPHVEVIFLKVAHLNNSGTEPGKDRKDRTGRPTRMCTRHATKHEKYFMKCHVPG